MTTTDRLTRRERGNAADDGRVARTDAMCIFRDELAQTCARLEPLLDAEITPISIRLTDLNTGCLAFAGVRWRRGGAHDIRVGMAAATDERTAVVAAALDAASPDGLLDAVARAWSERGTVTAAVTFTEGRPAAEYGRRDAASRLVGLYNAVPRVGRLSVRTDDAEFRVVRLPSGAGLAMALHDNADRSEIDRGLIDLCALTNDHSRRML